MSRIKEIIKIIEENGKPERKPIISQNWFFEIHEIDKAVAGLIGKKKKRERRHKLSVSAVRVG